MHTTEHDTGVLFYLFYCKCGCCPSTLINPQIYLKIAASRSKTQIKRYKRRPSSAANDVWTVKQPSETPGGFSTVLVKKKKKETRLGGNETIRWWKKEKKKNKRKGDSAALEGGTGRLTQREEQKWGSVFIFPSPSFFLSCLSHPLLFPSRYIYHSLPLSHFLCGIVLSVKSCHDKAVYF